jgi:hypothetical protein
MMNPQLTPDNSENASWVNVNSIEDRLCLHKQICSSVAEISVITQQ